jgi:DNA-binding CsgD family transcriptional regulator
MDWMDAFVRPVLRYERLVCGTGVFAPRAVLMERIIARRFPLKALDELRDGSGVIVLPRALPSVSSGLSVLDLARLQRGPTDRLGALPEHLGIMVTLDCADLGLSPGSYFLFTGMPEAPGATALYLGRILGPFMHCLLRRVVERDAALMPELAPEVSLTRREREIVHTLVLGMTSPQIAQESHRSVHTVDNQIRAIVRKLGARNRTEAVAIALSLGYWRSRPAPVKTRLVLAQESAAYAPAKDSGLRNPSGSQGASGALFDVSFLAVAKASDGVVVDHAHGLEIGVDDGRAHELEAEFFHVARDLVRQGRGGRCFL